MPHYFQTLSYFTFLWMTLILSACAQNPAAAPRAYAPAGASQAAQNETFTLLFSQTCMKYYFERSKLVQLMDNELGRRMNDQLANVFLSQKAGIAWFVTGERDKFVALRDDGVCTVFSGGGDVARIRENWTSLVSQAPAGLLAQKVDTKVAEGTQTGERVSYMWVREAQPGQLVFTLTTATDPDRKIKAISSMSWVDQ
jgi:hypothetical protein